MEEIHNPPIQKLKSMRLGKMSSKSWDLAGLVISDVLTQKLSGLQAVQVVTLYTSGMKGAGVLALLDKLVKDVSVFGILERSLHYGEATDEYISPAESEQMRLVIWNAELSAVAEFCDLYSGMVELSNDYILRAATCRDASVSQAIEWIARYAKSPIANYEGECEQDCASERPPIAVQLTHDDLYKVPCYRWRIRRKHLDDRSARVRIASLIVALGSGVSAKAAAFNHPQWPR